MTHAHTCTGISPAILCPPVPMQTQNAQLVTTVLQRSLNYGNGTEEDNNFTKAWIDDALSKANLTDEENRVKNVILSDYALMAKVFGPALREEKKVENDKSLTENHQHVDDDGNVYVHSHEHQNQDEDHEDDHIRHLNQNDVLMLINNALTHEEGQMTLKEKMISDQDQDIEKSKKGNSPLSDLEGQLGTIRI